MKTVFHGDTGRALGASQQTGWTSLIADLTRDINQKKGLTGKAEKDDSLSELKKEKLN